MLALSLPQLLSECAGEAGEVVLEEKLLPVVFLSLDGSLTAALSCLLLL